MRTLNGLLQLPSDAHRLPASTPNINSNAVQHTFGFGYNPRRSRENRFKIFELLAIFGCLPKFKPQ